MAMTLHTDTETLSRRLTEGLEGGLEAVIKGELMKQADVLVSKLAREMAQNLRGNIQVWRDYASDRVQVELVLDGVKELVPPRAP